MSGTTVDGATTGGAGREPGRRRRGAPGCLLEIVETLVLTVVIFFVVQTFVAQPFQVHQHSMERTFNEGDYVLVDRLTPRWSPYARGQVIVFQPPSSWTNQTEPYIKRVIAVGGDVVEIRDGLVYVNGVAIDEPYLYRDAAGNLEPTEGRGVTRWEVPAGELFVMGDHRQVSADSRAFGPIPATSVVGRGFVRYWPIGVAGLISGASYGDIPAP